MKKLTALVLFCFIAAISVRADVIYKETFNYTNGAIAITSTNGTGSTTVSNWITHSGSQDSYVINHRLEVSSSTAYGGVTTTRSGDVHRNFATAPSSIYTNVQQVLYASFVINFTNLPTTNGTYFAHFQNGSSTFMGRMFALTGGPAQPTNNFTVQPNTFRLGVSGGAQSGSPNKVFPIDLALNTDYQVVLGWDPVTLSSITLWVNPISSSDVSVVSGDTYTPTTANIAQSFAFRQASLFGGFLTVSNLVLSTTFNEAFTNVLSTNAVAPKFAYQPVGTTAFVGSSVAVSAVVAGQGLASLTYSWYKNGNPYSNPDGNTNVLAFASAASTDSGNYTVVATTPYGLSVTSSIATVSISVAPVPPTVTTQPASNTVVYAHQNTSLHVVASGPPTLSYQWFRNNSAISDNAFYSGTASDTLGIADITTGNANTGTYRVEITNPYGTAISSNAVISVVNPQAVSIAYLRTLVDPATFVQTNAGTIAYQVTGTVTTYTNITTGNTASYYLQDATAGINIFATFGSTFRPAQGDVLTYVGVLSSFTSGLELLADTTTRPYTSYTVLSNNIAGLPAPKIIPFGLTNTYTYAFLATNLAGSLVTLTNVYFGTNAGNIIATNANVTMTVTNASGQPFTLNFFNLDLDTAGQTLPTFASSVTGVLYGLHPTYSLTITKFSDIVTNSVVVPPTPIPVTAAVSGQNIVLSWTNAVFSLQFSTNVTGPYSTITNATSPYSVPMSNSAGFFQLKY